MQKVVIKKHFYISFFITLSLVFFIYQESLIERWSTALFSWGTYPFLSLYAFVTHPVKKWFTELHDRNELCAKIAQLQKTNQRLQEELIQSKATALYAHETQDIQAFRQRYHFKEGVVAQVLNVISTQYEQSILVNTGSCHGVVKNMIALSHNCLVGKVTAVYPWYCKVRLVTDSRCKVSALCASTGAVGIYHGSNNTECAALDHVSHLDVVNAGDLVLSAGKGLVFPQGFALGTISSATVNGLSYDIAVKPLLSLSDLSYCLLISKESCEKH